MQQLDSSLHKQPQAGFDGVGHCVRRSTLHSHRTHPYSGHPTSTTNSACSSVEHQQSQHRQQHMPLHHPWSTSQQLQRVQQQCKHELPVDGPVTLEAGALAQKSLEACVCIAINLSSRSLEDTMIALRTAHTIFAASNGTAAADAALNRVEDLMERTARRVQLALKLAQLQFVQQAPAAAAAAVCPAAGILPATAKTYSSSTSSISTSSSPLQQQAVVAASPLGGPSMPHVQHPSRLVIYQQKQVLPVQLTRPTLQAVHEDVDLQEEVGSSWE